MDLPTRLDYYEIGRRYVQARAQRIDPAQIDVEGSDVNLFVGSTSFVAQEISRQLAERTSALMLDGAEGEDLDRWAFDRYRMPRKGASAAVGRVRFFRPTTAGGEGAIAAGRKIFSLTGVEYVTTTQATFGAATTSATADARAVLAGKEYQVGRNQLRRIDGQAFDPTIEVTNDEPTAGGEPAEQDDEFRERVRAFWLAARRGTGPAIEFGARTVPGVSSASAVEAMSGAGLPARVGTLHVADSSGVASRVLAARVDAALMEYRACGVAVIVSTSVPSLVSLALRLRFRAGVDTAAMAEAIRRAAFGYVNSLGVNAPLQRSALGGLLQRFKQDGLDPDEGTIVEPAGDVVPEPGRTIRTTLDRIAVS